MNKRELAIKSCQGVDGFTESEFSTEMDITFKKGEQVREINIHDGVYNTVISLTHWCRPKQFHAADRVKIIIEPKELEFYPTIIKDVAKDFDMIVSEFCNHQEEDSHWLRGEIKVQTYLSVFK